MSNLNPFDFAKQSAEQDSGVHVVMTLIHDFGLSNLEAQAVWLGCPEIQAQLAKDRISGSKERGGAAYGSQMWLKRRFNLSESELDYIFDELWNDETAQPVRFLEVMTAERIAEGQLTEIGRDALAQLKRKFEQDSFIG